MSVNSKMTALADKIRTLLGLSGTMGLDAMATNVGTANAAVTAAITALTEKGVTVPNGTNVTVLASLIGSIETGGGGVVSKKPVVLEVEKITSDTYAGSTTYSSEEFILLDIYLKSGGTVTVTYGGLTKTITDDGTSENPNAQQVYFGTFNGVADEMETPANGTLTIKGDYVAFAAGIYSRSSKYEVHCGCITWITDMGDVEYIPDYAFGDELGGCKNLAYVNIPDTVKSIGKCAFIECTSLPSLTIPYGITSIPEGVAYFCSSLRDVVLPDSVTTIEYEAFCGCGLVFITIPESVTSIESLAFDYSRRLMHIRLLATTPPTIGTAIIDLTVSTKFESFIVPAGCGEVYRTTEGWSEYADYIVEEGSSNTEATE